MTVIGRKDTGVILKARLRHHVEHPPVSVPDGESRAAESDDLSARYVLENHLGANDVCQKGPWSDLVREDVAVSVRSDFVSCRIAPPNQTRHPLGHPTQAEKGSPDIVVIEELEQPINAPLGAERKGRPFLYPGDPVTVQDMKPILQFTTECIQVLRFLRLHAGIPPEPPALK
jgi:hypothetical protein